MGGGTRTKIGLKNCLKGDRRGLRKKGLDKQKSRGRGEHRTGKTFGREAERKEGALTFKQKAKVNRGKNRETSGKHSGKGNTTARGGGRVEKRGGLIL